MDPLSVEFCESAFLLHLYQDSIDLDAEHGILGMHCQSPVDMRNGITGMHIVHIQLIKEGSTYLNRTDGKFILTALECLKYNLIGIDVGYLVIETKTRYTVKRGNATPIKLSD